MSMIIGFTIPKFRFEKKGWTQQGVKSAVIGLLQAPQRAFINLLPAFFAVWNFGISIVGFVFAFTTLILAGLIYLLTGYEMIPVFTDKHAKKIADLKQSIGHEGHDVSQRLESMDISEEDRKQIMQALRKAEVLRSAQKKLLGEGTAPFTGEEVDELLDNYLHDLSGMYQMAWYATAIRDMYYSGKNDRLPTHNMEILKPVLQGWLENRGIDIHKKLDVHEYPR